MISLARGSSFSEQGLRTTPSAAYHEFKNKIVGISIDKFQILSTHRLMGISRRELVVAACMLAALLPVSAANAYELVFVTPPTPQPLVAPFCKVEICCVGAPIVGQGIAWHCFTKCTKNIPNAIPIVTACRGGPAGLGRDLEPDGVEGSPNPEPNCPGWNIFNGAWGPIDTYCAPFNSDHPDWREDKQGPCEAVDGGCSICECIEDVMCRIEACCVRYEGIPEFSPGGFNSNSASFTAIHMCQPHGSAPQALPLDPLNLFKFALLSEIPYSHCELRG